MEVATTEPAAPAAPAVTDSAPAQAPAAKPDAPPATETTTNQEAVAETALNDDLAKVWDKAHEDPADDEAPAKAAPTRAPDGKFKSPNAPAPEQAAEDTTGQTEPQAPVAEDPAAEVKWWPAELQAKLKALPPDVAKSIAGQALNDRQAISKLGNALQQYEPLNRVLGQYKADFDAAGVNLVDGVQQLLSAQQKLANPATRAEAYNFLLSRFPHDFGADDGFGPDPQVAALGSQIQQLQQRLGHYEQRERDWQESQQSERQTAVLREIENAEKALPDFVTLMPDIRAMIPIIMSQNPNLSHADALKQAHEKAGWANPTIRAKWQKDAIAKEMKAAAEQAEKAKRANGLNVASKQRQGTPASIDDLLGSVWDKRQSA